MSFVKWKEHLRRRIAALPAIVWLFPLLAGALLLPLLLLTEEIGTVSITDSQGAKQVVVTRDSSLEHLMELSGIRAGRDDRIYYTTYKGNRAALDIQRAFAVQVNVDGEQYEVNLTGGNVHKALERAGVTLGEHDYTVPGLSAELADGAVITVHRVEYHDEVVYEAIPFEVETVYTSLLYRNKRKVLTVQTGHEGEKAITHRERWVDGMLESSRVIAEKVTKKPKNTIYKAYAAGAPVSPRLGPDGTTDPPTSYKRVLTGRGTGYSSSGGRGASRLGLGYGTVAVDPSVIPYGTLLYIRSTDGKFVYGYAIATDTGTSLVTGHTLVDMYYGTFEESRLNGAMTVNVYVVG